MEQEESAQGVEDSDPEVDSETRARMLQNMLREIAPQAAAMGMGMPKPKKAKKPAAPK